MVAVKTGFGAADVEPSYVWNARAAMGHDVGLHDAFVFGIVHPRATWAPSDEQLDALWKLRGEIRYQDEIEEYFVARRDPRMRKVVEARLARGIPHSLDDGDHLFNQASRLGLGERVRPRILELARKSRRSHKLCDQNLYLDAAAGDSHTLAQVIALGVGCDQYSRETVYRSLLECPDVEGAIRELLPTVEANPRDAAMGEVAGALGRALPATSKDDTVQRVAAALHARGQLRYAGLEWLLDKRRERNPVDAGRERTPVEAQIHAWIDEERAGDVKP